jgi:predicted DNA binding CopG/RHH family protein
MAKQSTPTKEFTVKTPKIESTADAWDSRHLGASLDHVAVAPPSHDLALDNAMGMQSISIRLPKQLIDQYKLIAHFHGVGYQPLMRDILTRFVPGALQDIMQAQLKQATSLTPPAPATSLCTPPTHRG